MENEASIDLQADAKPETGDAQLPVNFVAAGEIANDDVRVYIKQDVYKQIERLARSDTTKELGGILLGDYVEASGRMHVVISGSVEAKYTDASVSTLTFTHETWDYVHSEHDKLFPELKILGWQHTHPNYGIFLSNYDMFIQENFFNLPFQIAYVVDPLQGLRGFFQWKGGKVEKLGGFYIFDDVGKPIKLEQPKTKAAAISVASSKKQMIIFIALLVVIAAVSTIILITLNNQLQSQLQQQQELVTLISKQGQQILDQNASIETLKTSLADSVLSSENSGAVEDLIEKIETQQITLDNQEEVLAKLKALLASTERDDANIVIFTSYTIQKGDSLSGICKRFGLDYRANISIIKAINGIKDPDSIYAGLNIILPIQKAK
jgi:proteasome lid subunit RPN8/RPN11/LysM repeat protein